MTVTTTYAPATFTGNGVTVDFALAHQVEEAAHVSVTLDGVSSSAWSATGYGLSAGITVTMDTAPASGVAIIIRRVVPYTQDTDFENFDGNPAEVTESQFDLLAMADQQIAEETARAILSPLGTSLTSNEITGTIDTTTRILTITTAGPASSTISDLSSTIDTTLTSLTTNDLLQWDGAAWVNVTTASIAPTDFTDSTFRIQDNGDATKEIAFEASSITTGTVRTLTVPDKSFTIADNADLPPVVYGHLNGLTLSNDTDADHDILIATGQCVDGGNAEYITLGTAITKQIDATWAVGDDAGGLDTGAVANNTWYYVWLIKRSDTSVVDALFSTSSTSPTMPTNYDYKRLIGVVRTDGSANIRAFFQKGDKFTFEDGIQDVDYSAGELTSTAALLTMTAPPDSTAMIRAFAEDGSLYGCLITSPYETDRAASTVTGSGEASLMGGAGGEAAGHFEVRVNASSQIRARSSLASQNYFVVHTYGFIFER